MKHSSKLVLLTVGLILSGCVGTLHPLYTEKDLVFENSLLGRWADPDDDESWVFKKSEKTNAYDVIYNEDGGKAGNFLGHLLKLEETLFLDLLPEEPDVPNGFYKAFLLPTHTFFMISSIEPRLTMVPMDIDWLDKHLEKHPETLKHEKISYPDSDDRVIVTAQTRDLQKFVVNQSKNEEAWASPIVLVRTTSVQLR